MSKRYEWKTPWLYPGVDANKVKQELDRIENSGPITAEDVVDYAREKPRSNLSKCFEWNDEAAADHYRLQQARSIIGNIRKVKLVGGKVTLKREYYKIEGAGRYYTAERLMREPDEVLQILYAAQKALKELIERFEEIEELHPKLRKLPRIKKLSGQLAHELNEAIEA